MRPAQAISFYLSYDIGGTAVRSGLISDGQLMSDSFVRVDHNGHVADVCRAVLDRNKQIAKDAGGTIAGISVALAGNVDSSGIVVSSPTVPSLVGLNYNILFGASQSYPTTVYNDANARTFAEWKAITDVRTENVVAIFVGTGIGAGAIVDGELMFGEHGAAVEIGHISIYPRGLSCGCGGQGCLEQYASGPAILRRANDLRTQCFQRPFVDFRELAAAREGRDPRADQAYQEAAEYLAQAVVTVVSMFDPGLVIIGGGVVEHDFELASSVFELARPRLMNVSRSRTKFSNSVLKDTGGTIGAALLMQKGNSNG